MSIRRAAYLVDPVLLGERPALDLTLLEPESDLLLGVLDAVGAVADVAADVDGVVTTDGARGGCKRVGGTEDGTASLDGVTALPDHGADRARVHVGNEAGEERLVGQVGVVLLEVLLARGGELDGGKLVAIGITSASTLVGIEVYQLASFCSEVLRRSKSGVEEGQSSGNVPTVLEARDDGANKAALRRWSVSEHQQRSSN